MFNLLIRQNCSVYFPLNASVGQGVRQLKKVVLFQTMVHFFVTNLEFAVA